MKMTKFALTVTDAMQSGNLAVRSHIYLDYGRRRNAMPWDDHGKYMNIWEKQDDGSMKLKAETWNSDVNPWQEMQKMEEKAPEGHEGHQH